MTPSGIIILMALVSHFVYVIYRAHNKLTSGDVGTIFTTKSETTVKVRGKYEFCISDLNDLCI